MLRISILLLTATLGSAELATAQEVTKPRSPTDRLPKPAGFTALQQPDGTILVAWQGVPGAVPKPTGHGPAARWWTAAPRRSGISGIG